MKATMENLLDAKKFWDHFNIPVDAEDLAWVEKRIALGEDTNHVFSDADANKIKLILARSVLVAAALTNEHLDTDMVMAILANSDVVEASKKALAEDENKGED